MFKYRYGPRPFVPFFLCCTVIGGDFDFVYFLLVFIYSPTAPSLFILFIHLFLLYVVRHVWG